MTAHEPPGWQPAPGPVPPGAAVPAAGYGAAPGQVGHPGHPGAGGADGPGEEASPGADSRRSLLRLARVLTFFVYAVVVTALVMLALGFVLLLFGASDDAAFTAWVYRNVVRIMEPFRGMFPQRALGERSILDFSLLFAMVVYGIVAVALNALVAWLAKVAATLDRPPGRRPGETRITR